MYANEVCNATSVSSGDRKVALALGLEYVPHDDTQAEPRHLLRAEYRRQCKAGALFGDWQPKRPRYKSGEPQPGYEIDREVLREFLRSLCGDYFFLQCFDEAKSPGLPHGLIEGIEKALDWCEKQAAKGWWIGLKPNVCSEESAEVKGAECRWRMSIADIDEGGRPALDKALAWCEQHSLRPRIHETSPGKYHLIFIQNDQLLRLSTDTAEVKAVQLKLYELFGGDDMLKPWNFTFRLPGTDNTKPDLGEPHTVRQIDDLASGYVTRGKMLELFALRPERDDVRATDREQLIEQFVRMRCAELNAGPGNHNGPFGKIMGELAHKGTDEEALEYAAEVFKACCPDYADGTDYQVRRFARIEPDADAGDFDAWLRRRVGGKGAKAKADPSAIADLLMSAILSGQAFMDDQGHVMEPVLGDMLAIGQSMMLFAWRGLGKTWVTLGMARAITTGGEFLGHKADKPRTVLYIDGEMQTEALQKRARFLFGGTPPDNFLVLGSEKLRRVGAEIQFMLTNADHRAALMEVLKRPKVAGRMW
jgi:hypothetical protein